MNVFRTTALFVEFSLYNINTDLLAVFSFLLEFPVSERAVLSLDLKTCSLHTLSQGLDLPLFLTVTPSQSQSTYHPFLITFPVKVNQPIAAINKSFFFTPSSSCWCLLAILPCVRPWRLGGRGAATSCVCGTWRACAVWCWQHALHLCTSAALCSPNASGLHFYANRTPSPTSFLWPNRVRL